MNKRRQFLGGCAAVATVMAMPAARAVLGPPPAGRFDASGLEAFRRQQGDRISLREGGSIVVENVEAVGADPRWEQCLVRLAPSSAMASGIYHLRTADGPRALYLEAGGSANRPMLTAAFSRLRA